MMNLDSLKQELQKNISECLEKHSLSNTFPYYVVFAIDTNGNIKINTQWPTKESPHVVTEIMGTLLAAMSSDTLNLHLTDAIRKFGIRHDNKALTEHIITYWNSTCEKLKQSSHIKPSEVFNK